MCVCVCVCACVRACVRVCVCAHSCPEAGKFVFHSVCVCIVVQLLEHFVEEYFDQNPISQLGIMFTNCKRAEKVTELGGNGLKKNT